MLIEWTDALLVGHQRIDGDHKALVAMINRLHEAIEAGTNRDTISEILHFLAEQTYRHFKFEEWLMGASEFPEAKHHLACHRKLTDELDVLLYTMELSPDDSLLAAVDFFENWFVGHVVRDDVVLARHLAGREIAAPLSEPPPS